MGRHHSTSRMKSRRKKTILNIERLELRALLTSAPITGFGINGDSLSDEYLHETYDYSRNWNELLSDLKGVNFGAKGDFFEPRRNGSFEYNWARYAGTSSTLLQTGQHTGLAAQINQGKVSHAILAIGQNDYAPWTDAYINIAFGLWSAADIKSYADSVVANITTALTTLYETNVHLVMSNIVDYGIAPVTRENYTPAQRDAATNAILAVNQRLAVLADSLNVPLIDLNGVAQKFYGTSSNPTDSWRIGGVRINNVAGVDSTNAFVDDGIHPHTVVQAQMANTFLTAFNVAYGTPVDLFTERQSVEAAGLTFSSNTLNYDPVPFIKRPNNSAPVITGVGGAAVPYTRNAPAVPVATAAVVNDADNLNFAVGTLTARISNNATASDRLSIANVGNGAGQIGVNGSNVSYGGTVIGTFSGGDGSNPLQILLNAKADKVAVQALVRRISFNTAGSSTSNATRTVSFTLADGDGGVSTAVSQDVTISDGGNRAPVLDATANPTLGSLLEGATNPSGISVAAMVVNGSITDADGAAVEAIAITALNSSLGTWQYRLSGGMTWLSIDAPSINSQTNELALLLGSTAQLRLLPFANLNGLLSNGITFRAWDMSHGSEGEYVILASTGGATAFSSASDTVAIEVQAVNDAPSFRAGDGTVFTDVGSSDVAFSAALQPDGKVVFAGYSSGGINLDFALVRYNADGSLDDSFGNGGMVTTDLERETNEARSIKIQNDGKLIVGGYTYSSDTHDFALVRYNTDGSLDTSFGTGGIVITDFGDSDWLWSTAIQVDGKIVIGGYTESLDVDRFVLARYSIDGTLDQAFGNGGIVTTEVDSGASYGYSVAIQPDGKILLAGEAFRANQYDFALVRYNSNGSLDNGFGTNGKVLVDIGFQDKTGSMVVQPDGKIVVAGRDVSDFVILRFNIDGTLDSAFGNGGKVITDFGGMSDYAYSVMLQSDGKIIAAGDSNSFGLQQVSFVMARYTPNGSLDMNFGNDGKVILTGDTYGTGFSGVLQPDGRIVFGGMTSIETTADFHAMRYNADGSPDKTFGTSPSTLGSSISYSENASPVVLDSDVSISDPELSAANNFNGATLTLARSGGANPQDLFSATGTLGALSQGANLIVGGSVIGTVTTNSGGLLKLTFNAGATNVLVNSAMRQIAYANASDAPPNSLEIDWSFSDGNSGSQGTGGALAATGKTTINIDSVPDPPVARNNLFGVKKDRPTELDVLGNDFDPDGAVTLTILRVGTPVGGSVRILENGRLLFTPDSGYIGKATFNYAVIDNTGLESNTADVTIQVADTPYQNPNNQYDVDGDLTISPLDVLAIVNLLNSQGASLPVEGLPGPPNFVDVNGDNRVDPLDVLELINRINSQGNGQGNGEGESPLGTPLPAYAWYGPLQATSDRSDDDSKRLAERTWKDPDLVDCVLAELAYLI